MRLAAVTLAFFILVPVCASAISLPTNAGAPWEAWVTSRVSGVSSGENNPGLAIDSHDHPAVVFGEFAFHGTLYYGHREVTGWQSEVMISSDVGGGLEGPVVFDSSDVPHAAVASGSGGLVYVTRGSGGSWSSETVSPIDPVYTQIDLKIDHLGKPHIVFGSSADAIMRYATKSGSSWVVTQLALYGTYQPRLALDSHGLAHITDNANLGTGHFQYYAEEQSNGSFTYEQVATCSDGDIAVDSHDVPHIACGNTAAAGHTMLYFTRAASNSWTSESTIGDGGLAVRLRLDSKDRPHIAFHYYGAGSTLGYTTKTTTLGWSTEQPVQATTPQVFGTNLAIDSHDRPILLYTPECLQLCLNPEGLGYSDAPWLVEPVVDAPPEAYTALAQNILQAAGLP